MCGVTSVSGKVGCRWDFLVQKDEQNQLSLGRSPLTRALIRALQPDKNAQNHVTSLYVVKHRGSPARLSAQACKLPKRVGSRPGADSQKEIAHETVHGFLSDQ